MGRTSVTLETLEDKQAFERKERMKEKKWLKTRQVWNVYTVMVDIVGEATLKLDCQAISFLSS